MLFMDLHQKKNLSAEPEAYTKKEEKEKFTLV